MSVLEVRGVTVKYGRGRDAVLAVRDASLSVSAGQAVFLTGRNGTGKSSLLKAMAGIAPYEGTIRWDGSEDVAARLSQTRWMPQDIERRCPFFVTVDEMLVATRERDHESREQRLERAAFAELRQEKNLHERLLMELSGGQRQLVMWAAGMPKSSRIFLLDETFRSFDLRIRDQLWEDLQALVKASRGVAVVVSHDACFMAEKQCPIWVFSRSGRLTQLVGEHMSATEIRDAIDDMEGAHAVASAEALTEAAT